MEGIMDKMKWKGDHSSLVDVVAWRKHVSLALTDHRCNEQEMVVRCVHFTVNSSSLVHLSQSPD
jgi:hypothetical protein